MQSRQSMNKLMLRSSVGKEEVIVEVTVEVIAEGQGTTMEANEALAAADNEKVASDQEVAQKLLTWTLTNDFSLFQVTEVMEIAAEDFRVAERRTKTAI